MEEPALGVGSRNLDRQVVAVESCGRGGQSKQRVGGQVGLFELRFRSPAAPSGYLRGKQTTDIISSMGSSSESKQNSRGVETGSVLARAKSLREHLQMAHEHTVVNDESGGGGLPKIYHERQRLQLCLLHALNNLLQGELAFTRKELDDIADKLPLMSSGGDKWRPFSLIFKRHRNSVTGDYDVNVLIAALASRGKEVSWFDRRKGAEGLNVDEYGSQLAGIIVNVPSRRFMNMWKGRHWIALRMINGRWYNLDSDFNSPRAFDYGDADLKKYLEGVFADSGEVLIISEGNGAK